jgi:hypothetical protein
MNLSVIKVNEGHYLCIFFFLPLATSVEFVSYIDRWCLDKFCRVCLDKLCPVPHCSVFKRWIREEK